MRMLVPISSLHHIAWLSKFKVEASVAIHHTPRRFVLLWFVNFLRDLVRHLGGCVCYAQDIVQQGRQAFWKNVSLA